MPYAVFSTGGKQYRVAQDDVIDVAQLAGEAGAEITFSDLLLAGEGAGLKTTGDLGGATIVAEVISQFKDKKVIAYKYRRRKGYHRTVGHRRRLTRLKIKAINL